MTGANEAFDTAHVLSSMRAPGMILAFVDDTDFHGDNVSSLAAELRVLAAVKLDSGQYAKIEAALDNRLRDLGQVEFHGADVFNPQKGSRWRDVSVSDRIAMFDFMSSLVERSRAFMLYAYISAGQYEQMRQDWHQRGHADFGVNRNAALKRVMLRSLQEELYAEGQPAMIMIDQDRARSGIERDGSEDASWLAGGGVLTAPSDQVAGLQLADALAFAIGRRFRRAKHFENGTATALDYAAIGPIAALDGRARMVLVG